MSEPQITSSPAAADRATPHRSDGLPMFWPLEWAFELAQAELKLFPLRTIRFVEEAAKIDFGLHPQLATKNTVRLDLRTMVLREYSAPEARGIPTIVDAPFAGHSAAIADFDTNQSLMETLLTCGVGPLFLTDWKSATLDMKDFDVDSYLAELNVVVDELGGFANLIGLCQGGWMSAMYAARFPRKVNRLVLAGSPIDTDAGNGVVKQIAHGLPISTFEALVSVGGGLMPGRFMLQGWKNLDPAKNYIRKYIDLYENLDDPAYLRRVETFSRWYESTIDLPGRWYLQVITQLFRENRLAKGEFVALGKRISLRDITRPAYLLAGSSDDITPSAQVFAADGLLGTQRADIRQAVVPGGHIGLFMGARALRDVWPPIAAWIREGADAQPPADTNLA